MIYPLTTDRHTIRIYHECEGEIEKSVQRITDWNHEPCRVMIIGHGERQIFLSHPHTNNGFFLAHRLVPQFVLKEHEDAFLKVMNALRCDMVTSFYHYNDVTDRRVADVRLFIFSSFPRAGTDM